MTAADEFMRTLLVDAPKITRAEVTLYKDGRVMTVTWGPDWILGDGRVAVMRASETVDDESQPATADEIRALGRWLDTGEEP